MAYPFSGFRVIIATAERAAERAEGAGKMTAPGKARVVSVNVGGPHEFEYHGHPAASAIWKSPVSGRVAAAGVNLKGDRQVDLEAHGGPDKAVYAYAAED